MNKNNKSDGLHRFPLSGLSVYMELQRILTTKETLTIKSTSVQYMLYECVCVCFYHKVVTIYRKKEYVKHVPLADESFKVNFQVKLPNGSRLQPTASTLSPVTNTRQLLNLTCLYWNTGASRTIAGYVLPIHRMYSVSELLHSSPADP